ncbi:hypothetical protein NS303_20770 [Pantoea ananatis]|uniref:hypothetical protein n=1 Tax=Pantoea TaxID=53335 RepID=UPI0004979904|nr:MULTISPECIES: hypothetical protein [Pantoea]AMB73468.1 hypothetical protein AW734_01430 [Pantoea ananatis]KTR46231.1 hypothetical protein NS303_20770 [Pantoea ananatis]KTR52722.1 hypothetical protein NS311_19980 [Pantoea ananatis]KTR64735.1 hypothetical protein RSA47_12420 [Pantoea ananatis]KTR67511.1 hypothetical protein NS296_21960 [Pantoea ananatis]
MSQMQGIIESNLLIKVKFYNLPHRLKLLNKANYPKKVTDEIRRVIKNGCNIKGADFVLYTLFYNKGYGITQAEFATKVKSMEDLLSLHIVVSNSTIQKRYRRALPRGVTDNIGESIGMLIISHFYGITNADWDVIPESNRNKTLDFSLAISASGLVQLETKGTSAIKLAISKPYNDICKKKNVKSVINGNYNYGTIATIDQNEVCCYLVDPPGNDDEFDVVFLRVFSRLQYYLRILNIIAPESELIEVIDKRLSQLLNESFDYTEDIKLKPNSRGSFNYDSGNRPTYFFNAYYDGDTKGGYGGRCFFVDSTSLLFVGVTNDLLVEIVNQDFEYISRDINSEGENVEVRMSVPINALHRKDESGVTIISDDRFYNAHQNLNVEGTLNFKNGLVIGVLDY